ncbi:hypothetical protein N5D99_07680 [Aeromonas caviae]|uniref:hypothetical protein n=1 Tax=Aeromonas caviae TaxID=648 RepID=UPI002449E4AF|nr:hypothetical protein [Aeromonas caviae]MDH1844778.1 hypothetical protein [Aeromonas caviae]
MGAVEGIRWEYALDGIFLAFYSVNAASTYVKMLLGSIFTILLIIFELIDKSLVTPVSISRKRFFAVFSSAFMARAFSGERRVGAAIPLLL